MLKFQTFTSNKFSFQRLRLGLLNNIRLFSIEIKHEEFRLIRETGENAGLVKKRQVLEQLKSSGLDKTHQLMLVNLSPTPVYKIIPKPKVNFKKDVNVNGSTSPSKPPKLKEKVKEIQITSTTGQGDLAIKLKKIQEFLGKGIICIVNIQEAKRKDLKDNHRPVEEILQEIQKELGSIAKSNAPLKSIGRMRTPTLKITFSPKR